MKRTHFSLRLKDGGWRIARGYFCGQHLVIHRPVHATSGLQVEEGWCLTHLRTGAQVRRDTRVAFRDYYLLGKVIDRVAGRLWPELDPVYPNRKPAVSRAIWETIEPILDLFYQAGIDAVLEVYGDPRRW